MKTVWVITKNGDAYKVFKHQSVAEAFFDALEAVRTPDDYFRLYEVDFIAWEPV